MTEVKDHYMHTAVPVQQYNSCLAVKSVVGSSTTTQTRLHHHGPIGTMDFVCDKQSGVVDDMAQKISCGDCSKRESNSLMS